MAALNIYFNSMVLTTVLAYYGPTIDDACIYVTADTGAGAISIYYADNADLSLANKLYADSSGQVVALSGYYSQSGNVYYWDGTNLTSYGACPTA